jgi:hypothetical protein
MHDASASFVSEARAAATRVSDNVRAAASSFMLTASSVLEQVQCTMGQMPARAFTFFSTFGLF